MIRCTVAIPVFNRVNLIGECVASALGQGCPDMRVLVVDNHSTDGTWECLQSLADPRLRLERNERNLGLFGNFNRCLELAEGQYLRFLCSDDRLPENCLEAELAILDSNPDVALLSGVGHYRDIAGRELGTCGDVLPPGKYPRAIAALTVLRTLLQLGVNPLCYPSGILFRRRLLVAAGCFDPRLRVAGDVDYFLRVLTQGDMLISRMPAAFILSHTGQISRQQSANDGFVLLREQLMLMRRHAQPHGPPEQTCRNRDARAWIAGLSIWLGMRSLASHRFRAALLHFYFSLRSRIGISTLVTSVLALLLRRVRYYHRS